MPSDAIDRSLALRQQGWRDGDGHVQAGDDVGVACRDNADEVLGVMREVGRECRAVPEFAAFILDEFEVVGLERWADSAEVVNAPGLHHDRLGACRAPNALGIDP